jgi:ferric-dicitrate binding protein FerR (iron transport regulator)
MTNDRRPNDELNRFRQLMTGALDGELSADEQAEFQQMLVNSPERQQEWNEHRKLKEITMRLKFTNPPEEVWDRYWIGVYNRIERRAAWILVSLGAMVVLFFAGYKAAASLLADAQTPWLVKGGILALLAGGVILFVSVLREKLFTRKTDKYKEVER